MNKQSPEYQEFLYYKAWRQMTDSNDTFLELVADGLTKRELAKNIERRPEVWKRFEGFMAHLPD